MRNAIALVVPFLLVGCGAASEACLEYTDANASCLEEAEAAGLPVDVEQSDAEGFCKDSDKTDEEWACITAAYEAGDCVTEAGLVAIAAAADAC